jgi:molybdenum cofactor cytidylyltransferase
MIRELSKDVGAGPGLRGRTGVLEWPTTNPAIIENINTADEISKLQLQGRIL